MAAWVKVSPPRRVPAAVKAAALQQTHTLAPIVFYLGFALVSSVLTVGFFPSHFLSDWRLSSSGTTRIAGLEAASPLEGTVILAAEVDQEVDDRKVWGYDFEYTLSDRSYEGRCYTTGKRWSRGQRVPVEYLPATPEVARIVGSRLSPGGNAGWFSLILPAIFLVAVIRALLVRRNALWLLERGRLAEARVESVELTGSIVNYEPEYKVALRFTESGMRTTVTVRYHSPEVVTFAETRLQLSQPVIVLYDPDKPTRLIMPEAFC